MTARHIAPPSAVLLAALLAAGCGSPERHCEYDATDADVPATYCAQEIDGYEWEPGPPDDPPIPHRGSPRTTRPSVGGPTPSPGRSKSRSTRSSR